MGRVIHFEVFGDDTQGLARFVERAFGWSAQAWEGSNDEYVLVGTGTGEGIDGAIAPPDLPGSGVVLTVATADLDADLARAQEAGGSVLVPKREIPGIGEHAYVTAPGGTVFGLLQPSPRMTEVPGGADERDPWSDVGERLREFGSTLGQALSDTAGPQAQRMREHAQRAAVTIGDASRQAADKARPHVATALDRVSVELGGLAERLRRPDEDDGAPAGGPGAEWARPARPEGPRFEGGDVEGPLGAGAEAEETGGDVGGEGEPQGDPTVNTAWLDDEREDVPVPPEKPLVDGREQE